MKAKVELIKVALVFAAVAFMLSVVPGCNTVEGVGEDIEAVGEGTSEMSRDVRD